MGTRWKPLADDADKTFVDWDICYAQYGKVDGTDDYSLLALYAVKDDANQILARHEIRYGEPVDFVISNLELPDFLSDYLPLIERVLRLDPDLQSEPKPDRQQKELLAALDLIAEGVRAPWPQALADAGVGLTPDLKELLIWNPIEGIYQPKAEVVIAGAVQKAMNGHADKKSLAHMVNETIKWVLYEQTKLRRRDEFDADPNRIVEANGILNIKERTLEPFCPDSEGQAREGDKRVRVIKDFRFKPAQVESPPVGLPVPLNISNPTVNITDPEAGVGTGKPSIPDFTCATGENRGLAQVKSATLDTPLLNIRASGDRLPVPAKREPLTLAQLRAKPAGVLSEQWVDHGAFGHQRDAPCKVCGVS